MHEIIDDGTDESQQTRCKPWWLMYKGLRHSTHESRKYLLTLWNGQETYEY